MGDQRISKDLWLLVRTWMKNVLPALKIQISSFYAKAFAPKDVSTDTKYFPDFLKATFSSLGNTTYFPQYRPSSRKMVALFVNIGE